MALSAPGDRPRTAGEEGPAAARWRTLVSDRLAELERLSPGAGAVGGAFWDGRAERYATHAPVADAGSDPFLRRLLRATGAAGTVIDAGAGTGRYALALAGHGRRVTAIDPSAAMLAVLRRGAEQLGLADVDCVQATWEHAEPARADVAFSSFVLTLVPDGDAFVTKLDAAARRRVLLYLGAYCGDAVFDPLWRHFHATPRAPGPSYLDAIALVRELTIEPEVKVVEIANRRRFATLGDAAEYYRDWLFLPDEPDISLELEGLLKHWLLGRAGALRSPLRSVPAAIIEWTPASRAGIQTRPA